MLRERLDAECVREVVLQLPDHPRDPMGWGAGRVDLAEPRPLRAGEHEVGDLAEHQRRQPREDPRSVGQVHEAGDGVEEWRLDRAHAEPSRGQAERRGGLPG